MKLWTKILVMALGLGAILLVILISTGFGEWHNWLTSPEQQFQGQNAMSQNRDIAGGGLLVDSDPMAPICDFWRPWSTLVSPDKPRSYLESIAAIIKDGGDRSEAYRNIIMKDPGMLGALRGGAERICIATKFSKDGQYHLDAANDTACTSKPTQFLEHTLEINIEPLDGGGFLNHLSFTLNTGKVTAKNFREFWRDQLGLFRLGYRGWTKAFPNFLQVNETGFGPVALERTPSDETTVRLDWLNQGMMARWPEWATFLLRLGDIATVELWSEDEHHQRLATALIESRLSSIKLVVPQNGDKYFKGIHKIPLTIGHNVVVRFRGLIITLRGIKYEGVLTSSEDQFAFEGTFGGVEKVEIGGAYRGLGFGGIGKVIYELVGEVINREIGRLKKGQNGQPAKLKVGLYPMENGGSLILDTQFEAAINVLNIVREEKDQVDSPVLPNKRSIKELNMWAQSTVKAIIQDLEAVSCSP